MKLVLALTMAILPLFQCQAQPSSPDLFTNNTLVTVKTSNVIGMPSTLSDPSVATDFGRGISKVSFDLKVLDPGARVVQIQTMIFNMAGEVKGGESWPIGGPVCTKSAKPGELTPVKSGKYTQILGHQLEPTDQVVLVVGKTVTDENAYEAPINEFVNPSVVLTARMVPVAKPTTSLPGSFFSTPSIYCGP